MEADLDTIIHDVFKDSAASHKNKGVTSLAYATSNLLHPQLLHAVLIALLF
jgi:hypothetical protein